MGRKQQNAEKAERVNVNFVLPKDVHDRLLEAMHRRQLETGQLVTRSQLIREAVHDWLEKNGV